MNNKWLFSAMLLGLSIGIMSCEREGPVEQTGEQIDEAVETAQDKLDANPKGVAEPAEEKLDESIEKIGERLEEVGNKIREETKQ